MTRLAIVCAIIGLALSIAGCGPSSEDANQQAAAFCEGHGGVAQITYSAASWPYGAYFEAECHDGSEIE